MLQKVLTKQRFSKFNFDREGKNKEKLSSIKRPFSISAQFPESQRPRGAVNKGRHLYEFSISNTCAFDETRSMNLFIKSKNSRRTEREREKEGCSPHN